MIQKQIQTSLRLISVSLSNVLYCIYDVSVVSRCTLYLNKILFTLNDPQKWYRLGTVSKNILLDGLNGFTAPTSLLF